MTEMIDLDAVVAARAEIADVEVPAPKVHFAGKDYDMPASLPMGAFMRMAHKARSVQSGQAQALDAMDGMYGLLKALFGERVDEFLDDNPDEQVIEALLSGLSDYYGVNVPKALDSDSSAQSTTEQ